MGKSRVLSFIVAILLLAVGGCMFISTAVSYVTYDTTQGEIENVHKYHYTNSKNRRKVKYDISYRYTVKGKSYSGSAHIKHLVSEGNSIKLYYSKSDPYKAKTDDELFNNITFSLAIGACAVIFLIGPVKTGKKIKQFMP